VDIDWRVGVTASTSETNASGASRVSVRLTLEEDGVDDDDDDDDDDDEDDGDEDDVGAGDDDEDGGGGGAPRRPRRRRRRRFEHVEMSVTQFYALARELEKARAALDAHVAS
jgi:hypothetical protein